MLPQAFLRKLIKMNSEHVRLSSAEKIYGEKMLLISQLNILNSHKMMKDYKKLRKEEFALKVELKSKIDETNSLIEMVDKMLPRIKTNETKENEMFHHKNKKEVNDNISLEQELEEIKRKLERIY